MFLTLPASTAVWGERHTPAFYKIDKARRIVLTTGAGVLTKKDIAEHQNRLVKDADFDPESAQLLDFLQVTKIELTPADVRELAERSVFSPRSRRAVLVKDDLAFGFARLFQTYRELKGEEGIRVFRELDDALAWLLEKNPPR